METFVEENLNAFYFGSTNRESWTAAQRERATFYEEYVLQKESYEQMYVDLKLGRR